MASEWIIAFRSDCFQWMDQCKSRFRFIEPVKWIQLAWLIFAVFSLNTLFFFKCFFFARLPRHGWRNLRVKQSVSRCILGIAETQNRRAERRKCSFDSNQHDWMDDSCKREQWCAQIKGKLISLSHDIFHAVLPNDFFFLYSIICAEPVKYVRVKLLHSFISCANKRPLIFVNWQLRHVASRVMSVLI